MIATDDDLPSPYQWYQASELADVTNQSDYSF
jgi:hypothetical protein